MHYLNPLIAQSIEKIGLFHNRFRKTALFFLLSFFIVPCISQSTTERAQISVWVNEAITATYTVNYKTYLEQQKEMATYFTSEGWIAYNKALNAAKLPEAIKQNAYDVTAVATLPPKIITLDPTHWQASMPLLVVYENPQYQQKQNLKVVLNFMKASSGQGVRGFVITSLQSTLIAPPCQCPKKAQPPSAPKEMHKDGV